MATKWVIDMQASGTPIPSAFGSEGGGSRVELTLEPTPQAPATARRALAPLGRRVPEHVLGDVQTVVSELVTNGVKYGPGEPIDVRVWVERGDGVVGQVADHGQGAVREKAASDPARGGLGLRIVEGIAEEWGTAERGSDVWFRVGI
jgi:signal transduction histidine kinase